MASDSYAGEPFFDNYTTYFGSAAFLDKFVMDALNGEHLGFKERMHSFWHPCFHAVYRWMTRK
jgi:hypothetical protein